MSNDSKLLFLTEQVLKKRIEKKSFYEICDHIRNVDSNLDSLNFFKSNSDSLKNSRIEGFVANVLNLVGDK